MSEPLLKPITTHDICSRVNAASNERWIPYSVHAQLRDSIERQRNVNDQAWAKNKHLEDILAIVRRYHSGDGTVTREMLIEALGRSEGD